MIFPQLYVFAGPNGAGKSTLSASMVSPNTAVFDGDIIFQNLKKTYADLDDSLLWANVNEVVFAKWKETSISSGTDAAFETNFRSKEIMSTVELFTAAGFETRLFFMGLDSVEASIDRVKLRVAKGGHNDFSPPGEQVIMTPLMNIHLGKLTEVNPILPEWASSLYSSIH